MEPSAVARLDHDRLGRTGVPEVIFAAGKTLEQNVALIGALYARTGFALATQIAPEQRDALAAAYPDALVQPVCGALRRGTLPRTGHRVAVVCAGTSDLPVAEEAAFVLDAFGHDAVRATDVGVAGIHRLFDALDDIAACRAVIVVAVLIRATVPGRRFVAVMQVFANPSATAGAVVAEQRLQLLEPIAVADPELPHLAGIHE